MVFPESRPTERSRIYEKRAPNLDKLSVMHANKHLSRLSMKTPAHRMTSALHDLVLCQAASVLGTLHDVAVVLVGVLHVRETKRSATILVPCELGCQSVSKVTR